MGRVESERRTVLYFDYIMTGSCGLANTCLDLYQFTGEEKYLNWAFSFEKNLKLYRVEEKDSCYYPGEFLYRLSFDFVEGATGVALFINRLKEAENLYNSFIPNLDRECFEGNL